MCGACRCDSSVSLPSLLFVDEGPSCFTYQECLHGSSCLQRQTDSVVQCFRNPWWELTIQCLSGILNLASRIGGISGTHFGVKVLVCCSNRLNCHGNLFVELCVARVVQRRLYMSAFSVEDWNSVEEIQIRRRGRQQHKREVGETELVVVFSVL